MTGHLLRTEQKIRFGFTLKEQLVRCVSRGPHTLLELLKLAIPPLVLTPLVLTKDVRAFNSNLTILV